MKTEFQKQVVYTIYEGARIKTVVALNPFGMIEINFNIPFTGNPIIEGKMQDELSAKFREQHFEIDSLVDEFNELVFRSIIINKRIERLCIKNQNESK